MIFDEQGVKVGITGLGPERMAEVTTLGPDTDQIPAIEAMEEVVPEMRAAGADIVDLGESWLTGIGIAREKLAQPGQVFGRVLELEQRFGFVQNQLSIELAEKVVNRSLDANVHKELVDAYIKEVGGMSGSNN